MATTWIPAAMLFRTIYPFTKDIEKLHLNCRLRSLQSGVDSYENWPCMYTTTLCNFTVQV